MLGTLLQCLVPVLGDMLASGKIRLGYMKSHGMGPPEGLVSTSHSVLRAEDMRGGPSRPLVRMKDTTVNKTDPSPFP